MTCACSGLGNLLVAMFGGMAGGLSISRSLMARMAGAVSRRCGAIKGVLCLLALGWGGPVIALVPRPLLGALLISLGIGMLKAWLYDSRHRVSRLEHLMMLAMLGVTALFGFLPAVCVGVLACCVGFAVGSSRLSPVRMLMSRRAWPSKVERSAAQDEYLQQHGGALQVIELQGVLFFGSVTQLTRRVEAIAAGSQRPQRLVFDFRHVRSLDTSAAQALARLLRSLRTRGLEVELSHLSATTRGALDAAGTLSAADAPRVHADIDAAVADWDNEALAQGAIADTPFEQWLARALPAPLSATQLLPYFEPLSLREGEVLFRCGDASDALYFVRSGRLAIVVPTGDGEIPVRSSAAGATIGEMGLLRDMPRSATARADMPCELLRLDRKSLRRLERDDPTLAAALYRVFMLQMASRLDQLTRQANALARPPG